MSQLIPFQLIRQLILFIACIGALSATAVASEESALFEETLTYDNSTAPANVLRRRSVIVTDELLTGTNTLAQRSVSEGAASVSNLGPNEGTTAPVAKSLKLNLFDGLVINATLTNAYQNRSGSRTWVGEITSGSVKGTAVFVVRNGEIHGVIDVPGKGKFSVRPGILNTHIVEEINNRFTLTGKSDVVIPDISKIVSTSSTQSGELTPEVHAAPVAISNDDGSIIDVYVAYDQDASGGSVDKSTAESLAELFIAYTNKAYENSGIHQRVWLVGDVDGYDVTSDNESNDLSNLRSGSIAAGLHAKRDEYHADLVLFFRPQPDPSYCSGLAYLQTNSSTNFEDYGFSVMQACTFGNTVFAHELGHNMGARHDWYIDSATTPASYAHGYVDITNGFKTIMSYNTRCTRANTTCIDLAHFSNPQVNYNGNTTGVSGGTSSACSIGAVNPGTECDADNARNFNEKAGITSQFRDSKNIWTGVADTNWNNAANWSINRGAPGATRVVNQVPRSYDNVHIPAGVSNYPTITGSAEARELTISIGASLNMTSGILTVGWAWEDDGGFNGTGGTVKFTGPIGITVTSQSASTFHNVEVGSGSDTSEVVLDSDINIDGNLTIKAGAALKGGAHTISLAGNWLEEDSTGFYKGTSTVVFDGATQTVNKTTTASLLNENFSDYSVAGSYTATLPSGWATSHENYFQGPLIVDGHGAANRWFGESDGYLFTPALNLQPGVVYTLQYDVATEQEGAVLSPQNVSIHLGSAQSPSEMTTTLNASTAETSTSYQTRTIAGITVTTAGTYYIGFRSQQVGDDATSFDNISLTAEGSLAFYNARVASGVTTFNLGVAIANDLQTDNGSTAAFGANTVSVEGVVTNNGGIKQTKTVSNRATRVFGNIKNAAGTTDKYFGAEITPSTGDMGTTAVEIKGNQTCAASVSSSIKRCYVITPTTAQTVDAKYYYRSVETNSNTAPKLFLSDSGNWVNKGTVTVSGSGDGIGALVTGLTEYGSFILADVIANITPDPISFTDKTNAALGTDQESATYTVSGLEASVSVAISVSSGSSYSVDSGPYVTAVGSVTNGNVIKVKHTASVNPATKTVTTLIIGAGSGTFTSTTVAADLTPTTISFADKTGVDLSAEQESATYTVSGLNTSATISVSRGSSYSIDSGPYVTAAGSVTNSKVVRVKHTSSASTTTDTVTTLTIGTGTGTFKSTTATAAAITPTSFTFPALRNVTVVSGTTVESNTVTIAGLTAANAIITVTDGEYSIGGATFTSQAGTVKNGDTIQLRHTAAAAVGGISTTTVVVGTYSATFSSTTSAAAAVTPTSSGGGSISFIYILLILMLVALSSKPLQSNVRKIAVR